MYTRICIFCCLLSQFLHAQVPIVNGWSQFTPAADSRLIYVSDVSGNDATAQYYLPASSQIGSDPFQPSGVVLPYRTLNAAKAQLRPGFPDWILFKRGETWTNQSFGNITLSGRSISEPMLISAYGPCGERPQILTGTSTFIDFTGASASHMAISGIYARPHTYTGTGDPVAIRLITAPFSSFLLEDCFFEYFSGNIAIHNLPSYSTSRQHLVVRRCILNRAYSLSGGGGLFIANVNGILFEENVIDHNGWHESISGAAANAFSHNTYFQVSNTNLIFRNNIVARASATGGGFRCGGIITNNLFLANPKNIQFGTHETVNGSGGGLNWPAQFVSGELSNNVVLDCRLEGFEAGTGIQVQRAKNTSVHHNLIAHFSPVSNYNIGAVLNETDNIDFHHNTIYNWGNNNTSGNSYGSGLICGAAMIGNSQIHDNDFQINNQRGACVSQNVAFGQTSYQNNHYFNVQTGGSWYQQWFQPQGNYTAWVAASGETGSTNTPINYTAANQNISTYMSSVGNPGGLDEFLSWSSQNSRCNWDDARTANAVNEYMRAGFNISVSLPLILTTLEGDFHDGGMLLRWTSTEEKDLDTYTVQRSNNGVKWQRLAELQARNKEKSEYHFYDNAPMATNYYRLQIRELNGATTYSRMLQMQMLHEQNFTLSPNPASTYLKLESKSLAIQHVQIVNAQNHICLQASGDNSPIFDIQHLPPGVYFVHIWAAGQFAVKKWVKI